MSDAELAGQRLLLEKILEVLEFSGTSPDRQVVIFNDRDSRRIISAILERFESGHDDGDRVLGAYISEDSTHIQKG
jgi:hypothetical protein